VFRSAWILARFGLVSGEDSVLLIEHRLPLGCHGLVWLAYVARHRQAGDGHPMAQPGLHALLAMAVQMLCRAFT